MTEALWNPLEQTPRLHSVQVGGVDLKPGDRVRLRPRSGGDVIDLALSGQIAEIESIEQDYEDKIYLAVVLDADPGRDLGLLRFPGHRFFFTPEEVEPLARDDQQ